MKRRRRLIGLAGTALLVTLWAVLLRPAALGGPAAYVVIRGSSMHPGLETGDLVITRAADAYGIGDVVAYRVPDGDIGSGHIVIHRIVGGDALGLQLQGDNNDSIDPWLPRAADVLGKAWVTIPGVGRILAMLHQPAVFGACAAALVAAMVIGAAPRGTTARPRTSSDDGRRPATT